MGKFTFNLGVDVRCRDDECGQLGKLVVNPGTGRVTDLIVEEGLFLKRARVVPIALLGSATDTEVYLDMNSKDLFRCQDYREKSVERLVSDIDQQINSSDPLQSQGWYHAVGPAPGLAMVKEKLHEGVAPEAIVIDRSTEVRSETDSLGKLDGLVADENKYMADLFVRRGLVFTERLKVPANRVELIQDGCLTLSPDWEQAQPATSMIPDDEDATIGLSVSISAALSKDPLTRNSVIEVVQDGTVIILSGEVDSRVIRDRAAVIATEQPGVTSVINGLQVKLKRRVPTG